MTLANEDGVVVGGATAHLHNAGWPVGVHVPIVDVECVHHAQSLLATHFDVVEGDVGGDVGGLDQAVVGDDDDALLSGFAGGRGCGVAVLSDDDESLDALRDHIVNLVVLQLHVVSGFLGDHFIAFFFQQFRHHVIFDLPALGGEVRERQADLGFATAFAASEAGQKHGYNENSHQRPGNCTRHFCFLL